jgi:glycosyltransferase involved in cell wall biosynthesis
VSDDAAVVTTVAVQREGKGLDVLIDAMARVRAALPRAVCLLAGDGPMRAALESRVHARGLAEAVRFLGMRDDVLALLSASDLFVQPSLVDALPTSVMEAMVAGLPVVATRTGGIPEMIEDGRTGVLVAPGDPVALTGAISGLLRDPERAHRLGANARQDALDRFHPARSADRLIARYEQVLGRA